MNLVKKQSNSATCLRPIVKSPLCKYPNLSSAPPFDIPRRPSDFTYTMALRKKEKFKIEKVEFNSKESFKTNTVVNFLMAELRRRKIAYDQLNEHFSFFLTELKLIVKLEKKLNG